MQFVAEQIRARNHTPFLVDFSILGDPSVAPDIRSSAVAEAAGCQLADLRARRDRGEAIRAMATGLPPLIVDLHLQKKIDGVIGLGGGGGTAIATAAMRALPIGFPKLMVSTLASGNTAPYIGEKDIVFFPSLVDIAGLNRLSRVILCRAAGAIVGMVETELPESQDQPLVVASMFGNTTDCVQRARHVLEDAGYEVLVFHATGAGGRLMESLIESGLPAGVLDITTTEWADEFVGGILSAGPNRLEAAARAGIPAVVCPGCLDMVNFGPPETIPDPFRGRRFYQHNPQVTLMRTTPEENASIGKIVAQKLNGSKGAIEVLLPKKGISVISQPGGPFYDPVADQALFEALKKNLRNDIPVREFDCSINDPAFAEECARTLLRLMRL